MDASPPPFPPKKSETRPKRTPALPLETGRSGWSQSTHSRPAIPLPSGCFRKKMAGERREANLEQSCCHPIHLSAFSIHPLRASMIWRTAGVVHVPTYVRSQSILRQGREYLVAAMMWMDARYAVVPPSVPLNRQLVGRVDIDNGLVPSTEVCQATTSDQRWSASPASQPARQTARHSERPMTSCPPRPSSLSRRTGTLKRETTTIG